MPNGHAGLLAAVLDRADKDLFRQYQVPLGSTMLGSLQLSKMMGKIIGGHWSIYTESEITKNWDRSSLGENDSEPRAKIFKVLRTVRGALQLASERI